MTTQHERLRRLSNKQRVLQALQERPHTNGELLRLCPQCGSNVPEANVVFCSRACNSASQRKPLPYRFKCSICGAWKETKDKPNNTIAPLTCSRHCAMVWRGRQQPDRLTRFLRRIEKTESGCWLWRGRIQVTGYGQFPWQHGDAWPAHRASWTLHRGDIPPGLHVCHTCDVRSCVNPEHLFLGTARDNVTDMWRKGRGRPLIGERHNLAKLTADDVRHIRASLIAGARCLDLAAEYGVSDGTIRMIQKGKTWTSVA